MVDFEQKTPTMLRDQDEFDFKLFEEENKRIWWIFLERL